ncbi:hypothetical protein PLESTB_000060300 [Pleodorina starrii]|uniref:Uncharacterized protein n=1 Tax=Pleodorina starrii TaxID=330485 RepID=A0A9W6BAS8_9CHLO|nr:hypothetical protein PLESTB_000060300 [Pleodorina starrii]
MSEPKRDAMGRQILARITATAEEDPRTAKAFLSTSHSKQADGSSQQPQDPVKPLTPEEEPSSQRLWKEYSLSFARRLNKM